MVMLDPKAELQGWWYPYSDAFFKERGGDKLGKSLTLQLHPSPLPLPHQGARGLEIGHRSGFPLPSIRGRDRGEGMQRDSFSR